MGKSLGNALYLIDDDETITKKIMNAKTDTNKIKKDDKANPNVCMVYYYHKLIDSKNLKEICKECKAGTRGCVGCKKELINELQTFLTPFREKRKYFEKHPEKVKEILDTGTKKAQQVAKQTMVEVKASMMIDY